MNREQLNEIINSYKWIKVKKHTTWVSGTEGQQYKELEEHHIEETKFLISKCRELASELLNNNRLTELLLKEVSAFWEAEGYSAGLTKEEDSEIMDLIKIYENRI